MGGIDVGSPGAAGNVERVRLADTAGYTSGATGRVVSELTADGGLVFSYVGGAANGTLYQGPSIPVEVGGRYVLSYSYAGVVAATFAGLRFSLRNGDNVSSIVANSGPAVTGSGSGLVNYTPSTVGKLCVIVYSEGGPGDISGKLTELTLQQVY